MEGGQSDITDPKGRTGPIGKDQKKAGLTSPFGGTDRNIQKTKSPSMDEWINRMRSTRTAEYIPSLGRKEILTHAIMWTNLKGKMLHEIGQ